MNSMCRMALLAVLTVMSVSSCVTDSGTADIRRLDLEISHGIVPQDSVMYKATEKLFEICDYGPVYPLSIFDYADKSSIREHRDAVEKEFADMDREKKSLGKLFSRIRRLLPEAEIPVVFTIISPYTQSIFVVDSAVYLGLNHYLGTDYPLYESFPDYVRRLKVRGRIPVDMAEAIIRTSYPFRPTSDYPQALSRMAYEGAVAEAVMQVADVDEQESLGYSDDDYLWLRDNEHDIWDIIVGKKMLFSSDTDIIRSLIGVGPTTNVISPSSPGRAGRYVGHRLVQSYLDANRSESLESLFSPEFYDNPSLLSLAGYNP